MKFCVVSDLLIVLSVLMRFSDASLVEYGNSLFRTRLWHLHTYFVRARCAMYYVFLSVQLLDEIILDQAGVDAGLDLQAAVEGLLAGDGLHGDHEVKVEPRHITGHHGQAGGSLQVEGVLVEEDPGYLIPVNHNRGVSV